MEHKGRTMLTEKIRKVECEPVWWNRDEVWLKVHGRVSPNRKRHQKFYFAAAAAALFICFTVYRLQQSQPIPDDINAREIQVEIHADQSPATDQQETKPKIQTKSSSRHGDESQHENHMAAVPVDKLNRIQMLPTESITTQEATNVEVTLNLEEPVLTSPEVVKEERIVPIIGIVDLSTQNNVASKTKRKKLFHRLEPSETEFDDSFKNTIIIARTK